MSGHTPGPWYRTASSPDGLVHGGPDHRVIVPHDASGFTPSWRWDDMAIIAAAPDMLAALCDILAAHDSKEVGGYARRLSLTIERARAIVAKAERR